MYNSCIAGGDGECGNRKQDVAKVIQRAVEAHDDDGSGQADVRNNIVDDPTGRRRSARITPAYV